MQVRSYNVGAFAFASSLAGMIVLNLSLSTYFLVNGDGDYNYNIGSRCRPGQGCRSQCLRCCQQNASTALHHERASEPMRPPAPHRTYTGLITNTMLVSTKIVGFWSCVPGPAFPPAAAGCSAAEDSRTAWHRPSGLPRPPRGPGAGTRGCRTRRTGPSRCSRSSR